MRVITLEEHFLTESQLRKSMGRGDSGIGAMLGRVADQLLDLDEGRLAAMDAGRVDVQVLSVAAYDLGSTDGPALARDSNDHLAAAVGRHPDRFAGFALLPMHSPDEAAVEFERAVGQLGFKGAMLSGTVDGKFLDDRRFDPIFAAASRLDVPIYVHPGPPEAAIRERYYDGFAPTVNTVLATAAWGWHVETGLHTLRMILGGVFDRFPKVQVIIGHLGEYLPYALPRTIRTLSRAGAQLDRPLDAYFRENLHYTTSGMFVNSTLRYAIEMLGVDRMMFSVDYPFEDNAEAVAFLKDAPISDDERTQLAHRNAERLLKL